MPGTEDVIVSKTDTVLASRGLRRSSETQDRIWKCKIGGASQAKPLGAVLGSSVGQAEYLGSTAGEVEGGKPILVLLCTGADTSQTARPRATGAPPH